MATKEKTFMTIEVLNILAWYKSARENGMRLNNLPVKAQWALKKNIDLLNPLAQSYEAVKGDLEQGIRDEYFGEEKSYATTQEQNGETVDVRQVKDEYLIEYNEKVKEVNQKLQDLLLEKNDVTLTVIDFDSVVEAMPDDVSLTMDDLDILSFMAD